MYSSIIPVIKGTGQWQIIGELSVWKKESWKKTNLRLHLYIPSNCFFISQKIHKIALWTTSSNFSYKIHLEQMRKIALKITKTEAVAEIRCMNRSFNKYQWLSKYIIVQCGFLYLDINLIFTYCKSSYIHNVLFF